jgi:hypothetical protein
MHQREEIRGREHLAEHFERLLTATHAGEPVVNQGYAQDLNDDTESGDLVSS